MGTGVGTALLISSLLSAGGQAVSATQQKKRAQGQAGARDRLERSTRIAEISAVNQQRERERAAQATTEAAASNIRNQQLRAQGINPNVGDLSVGALGRTSINTAASALDPIQPDRPVV